MSWYLGWSAIVCSDHRAKGCVDAAITDKP
jgi:hypothetical protein